jgi:hypothetical protein
MSQKLLSSAALGVPAFFWMALSLCLLSARADGLLSTKGNDSQKSLEILKKIYDEVKELGAFPGEDFIKWEFFVGQDDDDTNKNIHVAVLIQSTDAGEKMKVQVTFMEPSKANPRIKYAQETKSFVCLLAENGIKLAASDFNEKELKGIAPEILRAVLNKKKILREIAVRRIAQFFPSLD